MLTDVVAAAEEAATKESESRAAERVGKLSVAERALVAAQDDAAKAVADRTIAVDALAVLEIEMAAERRKVNDVASEVEAVAAALERALWKHPCILWDRQGNHSKIKNKHSSHKFPSRKIVGGPSAF